MSEQMQLTKSKTKRLNHHDKLKKLIVMQKTHDTETDAYAWIKSDLKEKGWNIKNPARSPDGEVYTQHEVNNNEELRKYLEGGVPENVVKINEQYVWVIEAKNSHNELEKATKEGIDVYGVVVLIVDHGCISGSTGPMTYCTRDCQFLIGDGINSIRLAFTSEQAQCFSIIERALSLASM